MDFKGNPFGPMPALMATAEYVTKVHAICTRSGNLANYSFRKSASDQLVLLGEIEAYEPLSRGSFYKAMLREKVKEIEVAAEQVNGQKKDTNV
jgi:thymidine kinase